MIVLVIANQSRIFILPFCQYKRTQNASKPETCISQNNWQSWHFNQHPCWIDWCSPFLNSFLQCLKMLIKWHPFWFLKLIPVNLSCVMLSGSGLIREIILNTGYTWIFWKIKIGKNLTKIWCQWTENPIKG